jgi:hypothetical protein
VCAAGVQPGGNGLGTYVVTYNLTAIGDYNIT